MSKLTHNEEDYYALFTSRVKGIGPKQFQKIKFRFKSFEKFYKSSKKELTLGLKNEVLAGNVLEAKGEYLIEDLASELERLNIEFLTYYNSSYPSILKTIYDPPSIIYFKGNYELLETNCFSIVGSRRYSSYGRKSCEWFSSTLANSGFSIVSGMAFGIDSIAHKSALDSGGKTIAVLASGVDVITPASNKRLYDEIVSSGLVISECSPTTIPMEGSFPRRNRIIAGLSKGVLIVEASEKSGSLITAKVALDYGRDVYALPNEIYSSSSKGCNKLIQDSEAKLVISPEDILDDYQMLKNDIQNRLLNLSEDELFIIELISREALDYDRLIEKVDKNKFNLDDVLIGLELKGLIYYDTVGKICPMI
jgi:DNA processing protein